MTLEERLIRTLQGWRSAAKALRAAPSGADRAVLDARAAAIEGCVADLAEALGRRSEPPRRMGPAFRAILFDEDGAHDAGEIGPEALDDFLKGRRP